jgi:hypothetical protein
MSISIDSVDSHDSVGSSDSKVSHERAIGYNLGYEVLKCYDKYFDAREKELNHLIDSMQRINIDIKVISTVMNKLAHAKSDKKTDLNQDEQLKKCAYLIHRHNPSIFGEKIHGVLGDGPTLEILFEEMQKEGLSDAEININTILERVNASQIKFDELDEDQLDIFIQGLDGNTKMLTSDLNEMMMKLNNKYEDRSTMTENARKVVEDADRHLESLARSSAGRR